MAAKAGGSVGVLPHAQEFFLVEVWEVAGEVIGCEYRVFDAARHGLLGFVNERLEVVMVYVFAYDNQVQIGAFEAFGQIADQVKFLGFAEVFDHALHNLVNAGIFAHEAVDVGKQGVFFVGLKDLFVVLGDAGK